MKLETEFCKLPLEFDADQLAAEVSQFSEADWRAHPQGHAGNSAIQLVSSGGDPANDVVKGPMLPTPHLDRCPYIRQVLATFETVVGRTRLMRIDAHGEATPHVDTNYYWFERTRVHVPVVTSACVTFHCGDKRLHMAAGETWIFDTWRGHNVLNRGEEARIHLVCDTVGSPAFWQLVESGHSPFGAHDGPSEPVRYVPFVPGDPLAIETELSNFPIVMTPWELDAHVEWLFDELHRSGIERSGEVRAVEHLLFRFRRHWRALWSRFRHECGGWESYRRVIDDLNTEVERFEGRFRFANGIEFIEMLRHAIVRSALNPDLASESAMNVNRPADAAVKGTSAASGRKTASRPPNSRARGGAAARRRPPPQKTTDGAQGGKTIRFERPVIVVAAPRSGSSLLFETLARSGELWTIGGESHHLIEQFPNLRPAANGFISNRLVAHDADDRTAQAIRVAFAERIRDRDDRRPPPDRESVRLLEKTPKNALRIPFLDAIFPDAFFVYLFREPRGNISSIIDAWRSGRFVTYPRLPGWVGPRWSLVLIERWRELNGRPLEEIAAAQWAATQRQIMADLEALPRSRWCGVTYDDLVTEPERLMQRLARAADFSWDVALERDLPLSRHTLTPPDPDKWKANAELLDRVLPTTDGVLEEVRALIGRASIPAG